MPYSTRQVRCMQAMGLVPWVASLGVNNPPDVVPEQLVAEQLVPEEKIRNNKLDEWSDMPVLLDQVSHWLLTQTVGQVGIASSHDVIAGASDASLIVAIVSNQAKTAVSSTQSQPLLSVEATKLLDLMLRSIHLNRNQISLCAISQSSQADSAPVFLSQLLTNERKALLLLVDCHTDVFENSAVTHHKGLLANQQLPFWRIPHPETLLQSGRLKRQAWNALKDIHSVLSL